MIQIRRSEERGHANHGWLDSYHTFSFASYYEPEYMGFGPLRVINEDRVEPGRGFGTHPHRDMEIISYAISGALEHKDSMGNGSVIHPNEIQVMSAGTGIRHSEYNASQRDPAHFLQIWIEPAQLNTPPRYAQQSFTDEQRQGKLHLLVSPDGRNNSVVIGQDALLYTALVEQNDTISYPLQPGRRAWIQVVKGQVRVNDQALDTGDAAGLTEVDGLTIQGIQAAEILLFDLP